MNLYKPKYIILHHSLTPDSGTVSWGAIRKYHKSLGWDDIGYHAGIEDISGNYEILLGRLFDQVGAHCKDAGRNYDSIGYVFVGNFDYKPPPVRQWDKGVEFVSWLCRQFMIPYDNIRGHRDFNIHKTCPGRRFDVGKFREEVRTLNQEWMVT